ncbi:IS1 family transposase [Persicitalea jodogahamensis]|uniref:Transposase n=1 Tax=Persicitalea jodogahamensis TaxID=402147 RepID=A0A8J3G8Q6_9BACT|nr:IS1 family transposase [Persicitalea jodogahamensis]GHB68524.1 hypothetical protein GCM10007390_22390 [Persicitalea jodogahamensis]
MEKCPRCGSGDIKKNGHIHNGKQNYYCKTCGRNFVENPQQKIVSQKDRELAARLFREGLSMRAISRVLGVSLPWVLDFTKNLSGEKGISGEVPDFGKADSKSGESS